MPHPPARFTLTRQRDPTLALGKCVALAASQPAFARQPFGPLVSMLAGQVTRRHYLLVARDGKLGGLIGWAFCTEEQGLRWLADGRGERTGDGLGGDCVMLNCWISDGPDMTRFVTGELRRLFADRRALFAKRHYADGRERPLVLRNPKLRAG